MLVCDDADIYRAATGGNSFFLVGLVVACIWVLGAAVMLSLNLLKHNRFMKMVNRWSEEITDPNILQVLSTLRTQANIKKQVGLKTCPGIVSPMLIGYIRPVILLPDVNNDLKELTFILRHELIHLKRNDLWYKTLVLLATALHWFNPVSYFMARAVDVQCEISCDELLVKETSIQQRKQYGETLIGAARYGANLHTALSTDFYGKSNVIKTRIFRIMDTTKKSAGIIIMCLIFITVIGSGIAYASDTASGLFSNVQTIRVDVKKLDQGNIISFEGPYKLGAGDIIEYDITSDNNENLYVDFARKDYLQYGKSIMYQYINGYIMPYPCKKLKVSLAKEGEYCIFVKFRDLQAGNNIKGTIKIIKGEE
jgi:beta-lactamase regulating signal transducer with metallopeptidase domain